MPFKCVFLALFLCFYSTNLLSAETFHPWSDKVFVYIEKEYGLQAEKRVRYLYDLIIKNQNKTVQEKMRLVNNTLNQLPWIADKEHWDKVDYWATPMETLATFGGDCEDIAIAKWVMLRHLGIPSENLRLGYVRVKATGEYHMILAYVERIDLPREKRAEKTWILDNIDKRLLTAPERKDLLGIYGIDVRGNMVIIKDSGEKRSILGVRENVKMKKLDELKQKIEENLAIYQELNEGRPLYPY